MTLKRKWVIAVVAVVAVVGIVGGMLMFVDFGVPYNADDWNPTQGVKIPPIRTGTIPDTGRIVLAESDRFLMEYSVDDQAVSLSEKDTEVVWSTAVDPEKLAQPIKNKLLLNGLRQLVNVTYTDFDVLSNIVNSTSQDVVVTETLVENGICFHLNFQKQSFSFDLALWLEEEQLVVCIPADSIEEIGKYGITSIDVLPMLMNSGQEEGYIVYPYGSGALYRFSPDSTAQSGLLTQSVYGMRILSPEEYKDNLSMAQKALSIPAYGIKVNNTSCVALIEGGDDSSAILLAPRGYIYDFDRVYASFVLRKTYTYQGPQDTDMTSTEGKIRIGDMSVRFMFPKTENATYSGMAALIRERLKSVGILDATVTEGFSAHLEFLMGATESTLLGDQYLVSTSYDDARSILEELSQSGVRPVVVSLAGWQSNGYGKYPGNLSMASALGGKAALKELTSFVSSKDGRLYFSHDFVNANADIGGFSIGREAVCNSAGVTVTDENEILYFLNTYTQLTKKLPRLLTLLADTGVSGIAYDTMGYLLYEDFKKGRDVTRKGMVTLQTEMLKESRKALGEAAVQGGNLYLLSEADFLYDISDDGLGLSLLDESIPFYQLVIHGYIPYSSDIRNNLVSDYEYQLLRCVEYGSIPSFILTKESSNLLVKTAANGIYTSEYAVWKDRIVDFCMEYGLITELQMSVMVDHTSLGEGVYQTVYDNGMKTVVNYTDWSYDWQEFEIPAKGYIVINEGGKLLAKGEGTVS